MIGVSKSGRVPCRTIEKLGAGYEINGRSTEEYKKTI